MVTNYCFRNSKLADTKAFYKGGKKSPIYHSNGKFGPHFHPNNPKFKHWQYYFTFLWLISNDLGAENG